MLQNSQRIRTICAAAHGLYISQPNVIRHKCLKSATTYFQTRGKKDDANLSSLFIPLQIKPNSDDLNVGEELTGNINKSDLLKILNRFYQNREVKQLLVENGLDSKIYEINSVIVLL